MLRHAWEAGVPMRWVTGDEVYGEACYLRDAVAESGRWYVLAVRAHSTVWLERPEVAVPAWSGIGRKPIKERVVDSGGQPILDPGAGGILAGEPVATSGSRTKAKKVLESMTGPASGSWRIKTNCLDGMLGFWYDVRSPSGRNRLLSLQCASGD